MNNFDIVTVDEEITFSPDEIIVSKTDKSGKLLYANDVFCRVAEMSTDEVIGKPHNLIRHPDMPRVIFKLLWDTISKGEEIFAYVKNRSKSGKYYWVIAHVTPSYDAQGQINGYHSNRRSPTRSAIDKISDIYKQLLIEENKHSNRKDGLEASEGMLQKMLEDAGMTYSQFVWSLGK
ncbi:PAS domain-containing protein [Sneathiella sp. P13V-1]|uniref:PAS domain-containing protein n=1 Tax=Sneathiella sp. P13V-1 TaxID=2697366 RepID=UPI00187B534A|nr:PAS domain-containing protein [Sneathiella sp. P13V-1]MBE7638420.1 PAS domain-containing protein [Sneathiella sp. P13V-1]